jgi:NarL family two-component system sensor histidine kinase LiaS
VITPERLDLARELHDGIAQDLVALGYSLDLLLADESLTKRARLDIRASRLQVDDLAQKVRKEIYKLRNSLDSNLGAQISRLIEDEFNDLAIEQTIEDVNAPSEVISELLAVLRESLRNIRAHARASRVAITLYPINNRICLQICDDGMGGVSLKSGHWGITGITERIGALGGSISIEDGFSHTSGVRITILL